MKPALDFKDSGWSRNIGVSTLPDNAPLSRLDECHAFSAAGLRIARLRELPSGVWEFVLYYEGIGEIVVESGTKEEVSDAAEIILDDLFGCHRN